MIFFIFLSPYLPFNSNKIKAQNKSKQHQFKNEAAEGNNSGGDKKISPFALILPVNHRFAKCVNRNGRTGGINGQKVGLYLADDPKQNGYAGNYSCDFVGDGHVFPVHDFFPFFFKTAYGGQIITSVRH